MNKLILLQWTKLNFTKWQNGKYTWMTIDKPISLPLDIAQIDMKNKDLRFVLELIYD